MLTIDSKDCESIDRALKKYKKKADRTQLIKKLRAKKHFTKPSVKRRHEVLKAIYVQQLESGKIKK
jgi:small subunit ribosomal protein S21